jgi:polysaccharide biosynthesis protein PslH
MKILLLCNKSPWPPKDGGAAATSKMISSLLAGNSSVTVLALNTSKHFVRIEDIPDELKRSADYKFVDIDTTISISGLILNLIFSEKPYNVERFRSRQFDGELKNILKNDFDLIQIEGLSMCVYLKSIRENTNARVVYRAHNIESLIWSRLAEEVGNPLKRAYFKALARRLRQFETYITEKVDAIVAISPTDFNWFRSEGHPNDLFLSPPGFDPLQDIENISSGTNEVFFIGALDWLPNIYGLKWFVKNVWPLIKKRVPGARFVIAGRNPSKVATLFRGTDIIFEGEVESSVDFMKDKSIMVVPQFSGSGTRMKIIEGMSLGKCIVSTPSGAEGVICRDRKDIFIESGASGFADIITELLYSPALRIETGKRAIENVRENYNIFVSPKGLMNFYRELTS